MQGQNYKYYVKIFMKKIKEDIFLVNRHLQKIEQRCINIIH